MTVVEPISLFPKGFPKRDVPKSTDVANEVATSAKTCAHVGQTTISLALTSLARIIKDTGLEGSLKIDYSPEKVTIQTNQSYNTEAFLTLLANLAKDGPKALGIDLSEILNREAINILRKGQADATFEFDDDTGKVVKDDDNEPATL